MLTDTRLRKALGKKRDKIEIISDSHGLNVRLSMSGSITFFYRYRWDGKAVQLTIGDYPTVSLSQARERRQQYRSWLTEGFDPRRQAALEKQKKIDAITVNEASITGRSVDIAINNDPSAVAMHTTNHPFALLRVRLRRSTKNCDRRSPRRSDLVLSGLSPLLKSKRCKANRESDSRSGVDCHSLSAGTCKPAGDVPPAGGCVMVKSAAGRKQQSKLMLGLDRGHQFRLKFAM